MSHDSFASRRRLRAGEVEYDYFSLPDAGAAGGGDIARLPMSLKILLENLLRHEDGRSVTREDILALGGWADTPTAREIAFRPARVLMQDFTGVPAVADLAAMRDAVAAAGKDPRLVNPLVPVDLVIDHSVMVDRFGDGRAFERNVAIEMERNQERYRFLRWGQSAFDNFRVVPPGTGICHQVNLEHLAQTVWSRTDGEDDRALAYPDTVVGTDSHTTMINALGVLGWGVGGIEAEAAMLGQPISMLVPEVVGFELAGALRDGVTATDLVLRVVERLRRHGVVGKFVEFFGDGLDHLPLTDRATIANMAPEYGATCGFFPVDAQTIRYLALTGRAPATIALVEAYAKAQGLWRTAGAKTAYSATLRLRLDDVRPALAGPKRPQDRVPVAKLPEAFADALALAGKAGDKTRRAVPGQARELGHGDVVIAAITSCTNTSNPAVMLGAGLLAKKAVALGLGAKPWVKTSLAPGSKVVTEYLRATGLQDCLDRIGFNLVGYGCTTCIGNSGPLPPAISQAITDGDLVVCSVLSGNRNFEGRVHQEVRANWLASPPLVVAYALAGTTRINLETEPLGQSPDGTDVFLRDIWPSDAEIQAAEAQVSAEMFARQYADVFTGPQAWRDIPAGAGAVYAWPRSTYINQPPFFSANGQGEQSIEIAGARVLALLGDSVTTDHISPAGAIQPASPAGEYLRRQSVPVAAFNSYGSRRGNHEVMMRGTFANIRIQNEMTPRREGGYTRHVPSGRELSIYDAAMRYRGEGTPLVVFAGREYGTGSSRDWAAKGTRLLGVKAVIAESFERIHRSNLVGMGVLPIEFAAGESRQSLGLNGTETVDVALPPGETAISPGQALMLRVRRPDGTTIETEARSRLDTQNEIAYFQCGGILQFVLNRLIDGC